MLRVKKCAVFKKPKPKFLGGSFGNHNLTLWQKLEHRGIKVGSERYNSGFSIWDFESITTENPIKCGENLVLEGELIPISCAVCSTDADFRESKFFLLDNDPQKLIDEILDYLLIVQQAGRLKRIQELQWVFDKINEFISQLTSDMVNQQDEDILCYKETEIGIWNRLLDELDSHCSEHIVFGWNSSKYVTFY